MKYEKILVTGGSGMVGNAIKSVINNVQLPVPKYYFMSRQDCDLVKQGNFYNFLKDMRIDGEAFDAIIHLAARVGGVKANINHMGEFYYDNIMINSNILHESYKFGIKKVVMLLSTCVYPDAPYVKYPLTEDQLHMGPPHESNFGYAYAKRMLDMQSRAYRQQYGCNFICAIPNNLYGIADQFDLENSHVIPALIRKIYEAKINNKKEVEVWGDGSPLREFTYSDDIAKILLWLLENYDEKESINIGNTEETSIKKLVEKICKNFEYYGKVFWNTDKPNGQFKKPSSNQKLLSLGWEKEKYTSIDIGLKITCDWFKQNYPNIRGIK